jgi:hypothetical protein
MSVRSWSTTLKGVFLKKKPGWREGQKGANERRKQSRRGTDVWTREGKEKEGEDPGRGEGRGERVEGRG